jgi:pimeloyl-ACP methyl ester carboxylesterase
MPKAFVNGINIDYNVAGDGEPLVLIMGLGGSRRSWIFQKRAFRKYFQVITFDNRGVGGSDKPDGPYSMAIMAGDTVGLMDYLGIEKAHIIGVSMGGMVAQEIAITDPERINKLVLCCTFAYEPEGHTPEYYKGLGVENAYSRDALQRVSAGRIMANDFSLAINDRLMRTVIAPLSKVFARVLPDTGIREQFKAILNHDTLDRLHSIQAPTLVITGDKDRIIRPDSSDVLAGRILGAKLVKVEGGSHAFFVSKCARFNREVLHFLRDS